MPNITNSTDSTSQANTEKITPVLQNETVINLYGNCLSTSNFCMNGGKCGLNGNCICARFFYGKQCEFNIPMAQRVTLESKGIGQERVFLICAMFILVLPFLAYLLFAFCIKMCDKDEESCGACLGDTFFCFPCLFKTCDRKELPRYPEDPIQQQHQPALNVPG